MSELLPGPVVSVDWLASNRDAVRIVDMRWSIPTGPKRDEYLAAHIPGAVFSDLDQDASAPAGSAGRHPLPTAEDFAAACGRLGIDRPVVVYDDCKGAVAARLWWLLDCLGQSAAVLDGGIQAWSEKHDLVGGEEHVSAVNVSVVPWPEAKFIQMDQVMDAIESGSQVIDARSSERFRGESNPIDRIAGHIPGSQSRPWQSNVDDAGFLNAVNLKAQFASVISDGDAELICTCGSGVTACHNLLAARMAGVQKTRLFTGSWSQWTFDDGQPVATS